MLFVSEASYLSTGYGVYAHEILKRLHQSNKIDFLEFATFGDDQSTDSLHIPWEFVGNLPDSKKPNKVKEYESNLLNKFGAWKFEDLCIQYQPDIVFDYKDWWYMEYQERSPFRKYYNLSWMPTCDSEPQNEQWLSSYIGCDAIFTYTDWSRDVLVKETNNNIKYIGTTSPGADLNTFFKFPNKTDLKKGLGFSEDDIIIGTTMRNQKRKLFPDLIEAFDEFIKTTPKNVYLYLHTSYPDMAGWDIPKIIKDSNCGHRILLTYHCSNCKSAYPSFYQDAVTFCKHCKNKTAVLPNAQNGVDKKILARIYNLMDVYIQFANSEGFGMPAIEAASCEVPVMAVNYSAMSDIIKKLEATPIEVERFSREAETHCLRALPSKQDFINKLNHFVNLPITMRNRIGYKAREGVIKNYNYDKSAKILEDYFLSVELKDINTTWLSPAKIFKPNLDIPQGLSNEEFVRWSIANIACRPDLTESHMALRLIKDLNWGSANRGMGGLVFNDSSALGLEQENSRVACTRETIIDSLLSIVNNHNHWESKRVKK